MGFKDASSTIQHWPWLFLFVMAFAVGPLCASAAAVEDQEVQRLSMTMDSYSYQPRELTVRAGQPVELTLHNAATFTPHSFVVDDAASGLHLRAEVPAGETQTIRFTPSQRGIFPYYCDKKLLFFKSHRERGQEGRLEVQ
jgi:plastocyanin